MLSIPLNSNVRMYSMTEESHIIFVNALLLKHHCRGGGGGDHLNIQTQA